MLERIIQYSIQHKLIVLLLSSGIIGFGVYSIINIPIGAVPDVTNNQVQIITTSRNLAAEDVEKFLTYPVELEMANLPGVLEIRSVSKFGLSVVTVVFEDAMGTYLPRQLIAEKIKTAEEKIPGGFGKPFMGPVTTGLGEIYQYVIEVDSAYRDKYSLTDLRTIQDWVVRRQLSGIPGVVEVNTWGGYLKQYEVTVDPEQLRSMQISVPAIFRALEKNNSVAGGGYIEKADQAYFIRGEGLVNSLEDIGNIVVENRGGIPICIKDVARVGYGHATRFGAITGNGEGEKVMGQVMMLKDGNPKAVLGSVKERIAGIQATLPRGIHINPFLERGELIEKTTFTIAENLILGCLIVVFVVVLLLGNLRSGLVVASVIPLCLLFAVSLMYIFGVDANLMSLGAIDFGIIIDGAVIIVEFIAFRITSERSQLLSLPQHERRRSIDAIALSGASKMMHSAIFGQLIIIIVFIPIFSLVNVEGKMFRPMALVFCFALLGAVLLCFTYVPVMASLFIKPASSDKKNLSARFIAFLERRYEPVIGWTLRHKALVLGLAIAITGGVGALFTRIGGEFVPTLDEGDFVIQPILRTGTSLSATVGITSRIESILKGFPEVEQVVSRVGAAEVPTDPMSMEESDVIIKLKPRSEWVSARNKDELADRFKEALAVIPGVEYEFTQPIEMRFNELITGVRADLAIKIFGEDLDLLNQKALEVRDAISGIPGAADIIVEKTAGLPQMSVRYDRRKIARYGLNLEELNQLIAMGFAGMPAGTVYEGEKQFDLVVRFDREHLQGIGDLENTSVQLDSKTQLPLSEFAEISNRKGPARISRDNTKRRVVVGVNVRNRDLESVVADVQQAIRKKVKLPPGYTLEYGGQFENLRTAKARLMIAVPVALLLILLLLYFAFNSLREALIIYSAIPLAAVGGLLLLYLRGMPFSISAGVGFIALFGIAVLNGIVLIEEFRELKAQGVENIRERILTGTKKRLRPVLLTAFAAALGFLPMAVSRSAGAEVQRPLATVVVGGLVTATALTLLVLPVLYAIFDRKAGRVTRRLRPATLLVCALLSIPLVGSAQAPLVDAKTAVRKALENHAGLKAAGQRVRQQEQLIATAADPDKTEIYFNYDQNNIAPNNLPLRVWGVNQTLEFPTVYGARKRVLEGRAELAADRYELDRRMVALETERAYWEVVYHEQRVRNYAWLDSLYREFYRAAEQRFSAGASNYLEKITAESRQKEIAVRFRQSREKAADAYQVLNRWIQSDTACKVVDRVLPKLEVAWPDTTNHPGIMYFADAVELARQTERLEKQMLLPDLQISLFRGANNRSDAAGYYGIQAGVAVPVWFRAGRARIDAARTEIRIQASEGDDYRIRLRSKLLSLRSELLRHGQGVAYYESTGRDLAEKLVYHADMAFKSGEIDFLQYVQLMENARNIGLDYLSSLYQYNLTVLEINYLIN